jgi:aldehyde dehydrogenase (NAD+)
MGSRRTGHLYIDGEWRDSSDGKTFDVINPADESLVGTAADATLDDVSDAVASARAAFDGTDWSTDVAFRRHCITQLDEALRKVSGELVEYATLEAGIPSSQADLIDSVLEEVSYHVELMDTFGWEIDLPTHEMLGMRSNRRVRQEARGVVGAITPWNAPTAMNVGKTVPALAAGNTVVLKPAPDTPLEAVIVAEAIANYTDIPPGVFNLITSNNNAVGGDGLTGDPRVNMFHFTGSTGVGQRIASRAAIGFRKVVLELGGKSANIILDDADLDAAMPYSVGMCMYNSGQGCLLPTRIVVHASRYADTVERAKAIAEALPWIGNGPGEH